jgi:succinate dehydrogenase flavin-adding protein (antitoxin of CptAB toxin-antitoxin module)
MSEYDDLDELSWQDIEDYFEKDRKNITDEEVREYYQFLEDTDIENQIKSYY